MDPYDEARLRNEVIYLHHLWHQGPPNPNPSFTHLPHQYTLNHSTLQPRKSTTFKKKNGKNPIHHSPSLNSGSEWPIPTPPENSAPAGWPPLEPRSTPATTRPVSAQEKALQLQYKARQVCREFLFHSDDHNDDDDGEEDEDDVAVEIGDFFVNLFAGNDELRKYYEKCWERGEFRCLVCGLIDDKNVGKRFHDCVGLVQHAMTISRTKTRRAHRAFGNAVCKILGWDVNSLPTIVINNDLKPAQTQGEPKEDPGDEIDGSESADKLSVDHLGEPVKQDAKVVHETVNQVNESFSKEDNLNQNARNLDEKISDARSDKVSLESPVSDVKWVCQSPNHVVSSAASGWPAFNTQSTSHKQSLSSEEQANLAVLQLQHKALETCQEFLVGNVGSDSDQDDSDDEDNEDDEYDPEESEEFKFFLRVFSEDKELRTYYENNYLEGDLYCLVCGGIGKKVWKRFKDCVALLQHSTAIVRTKRRRAHRAYAHAICKVLGWDFDRLPTIVPKGETLGSSLTGSGKLCEPEKSTNNHIGDLVVHQENSGQ